MLSRPLISLVLIVTPGPFPLAVLNVNQEPRTECLQFYTLGFGVERTILTPPRLKPAFIPWIYVNWNADRVCFMSPFWYYDTEEVTHTLQENKPTQLTT